MATTVGANGLNVETVVSQPCSVLMVNGLDYIFDQAKFEEYLSASSSDSSTHRKYQRNSSPRREVRSLTTETVSPLNNTQANYKAGSSADSIPLKESSLKIPAVLTKRACQRQRQKMARQFAKALESTDGVHYHMNSHDQRRQQTTAPRSQPVSTPSQEEWVLVKRFRSTKKERAQRRRAHADHARAILRQAQESKVAKKPSRKVWVPKSIEKQPQNSVCTRDRVICLAGRETAQAVALAARQPNPSRQPRDSGSRRAHRRDSSSCRARSPFIRDRANRLAHRETAQAVALAARQPNPSRQPRDSTSRRAHSRDISFCLARSLFTRDSSSCLGQGEAVPDTSNCPDQSSSSPFRLSTSSVFNRLGLLPNDKGKAPVHKRLGHARQHVGGRAQNQVAVQNSKLPIITRLSIPQGVHESAKGRELKPKPRRFRKRRSVQRDDFPEVTINMANKGKGAATDADPDFTPGGRVSSQISRRMSRLQLRATKHVDYRKMHEGESSEDEISDSCSAVASDSTMSSVGQAREAFTITPETFAQMLQEALAKQREELRAEMKTEVELAMQQMRELQNQKAAQPESSQQGGTSRRVAHDIEDSDTEVDEHIHADQPPNKTAEDLNHPTGGGLKQEEDDSGKMKELEGKINALMSAQKVKKMGIPYPYPREWDSIPYPAKFNLINFTPFDGRGSPTQHLIYFKSHLGVISGNEPLMVRSFVGTLRGAAFDWYRRLKAGSINCWDDMESSFLNNFFDDETEVSIGTLLDEKQKSGETIDAFVKRFRNKAINCKDPITEEFILQTCHNNLSIDLLEVMGVVPPTTWKDLKIRGEQAERFLKRKKNERGEPITGLSNSNLISRSKKNASAAAVDQKLQQQHPRQRKTSDRRLQEEYSFKDEEVPAIFKHLLENNKIKLPPITNQEEADKTSDPKYCAYHRRILHPTKDCLALKAIIQALVEAGVLTPK